MVERPPRDGARWGADPAPPPSPKTKPPPEPEYVRLCREYGQQNTDKALEIFSKIKTDFPNLKRLSTGRHGFASYVLERAKDSMEVAARDGRVHTMPKTLDIFERSLGNWLSTYDEDYCDRIIVTYGDTKKDTKSKARKTTFFIGVVVVLVVVILPFIFLATHTSDSWSEGLFFSI